jgi:glycerophosphoryl diester phosphodiesterase
LKRKQQAVFPQLQKPFIFAHQGGEALAPTNTMAAFEVAAALGEIDFLDIDVHMTRDGYLAGIHDKTVDRTTNGHGRVDAYTLAEIQQLDAGYWFKDLQGHHSYRGKGVRIPELAEVFRAYAEKFYFHFEVKDSYPKIGPSQIEEKLWTLIQQYHMQERVIVSSFHQRIVKRFQLLSNGQSVMGAGEAEVAQFVLAHKLRLPGLYRRRSNILSIPTTSLGINLKDQRLIDGAHRLGMHLYYWTIDDKVTMTELLVMGADGIFTNRPDLLKEVMHEMP